MYKNEHELSAGEMEILVSIGFNKTLQKRIVDHKLAITNPYIGLSINSLVNRGYLQKDRVKNHVLTSRGREVLVKILSEYDFDKLEALPDLWLREEERTKEATKSLRQLQDELSNKMKEFKEKQISIN